MRPALLTLSRLALGTGLVFGMFPTGATASSSGTDEYLSTIEMVPPIIIFVIDRSADMDLPCDGSATGDSCLTDALSAVEQVTRHFNFAQFGVIGTSDTAGDTAFFEIAPVGSSAAEMSSVITGVTGSGATTRNLGEVLEDVSENYIQLSAVDNETDDDGDGMTGDWDESPVVYSCTDIHYIVLTRDRPTDDDQVSSGYYFASNGTAGEIACDASGLTTPDSQCYYDNVAANIYNEDQSSLADHQRALVHTVSLNVASGSIAESLFLNAQTNTVSDGVYTNVDSGDDVLSGIFSVLTEIQAGTYTRSTPVVSADGAYLIYTFYELTGDNPLAEGHIRAYALDNDPTSATYGQVDYAAGDSAYGYAVWDGGDLLVSRPVTAGESNPDDRDGVGKRDIYVYEDNAYLLGALGSEGSSTRRIGFDYEFVQAVGASSSTLDLYFDTTVSSTTAPCAEDEAYDLDGDCLVDGDDLQALVDFARGLPEAEFRYIDLMRGTWKLGDSPYSVPVVVSARNDMYSTDSTYRQFLRDLESDGVPSVVLVAANDGMLHAFRLEDDPTTSTEDEAGEELWAWIPGYLLLRDKDQEWANSLIDLMWYGKTFLFDGSPVVEDVWIDDDGDGDKAADEWHRVVVVQQGLGGPVTMSLDITDTTAPEFLWEQTNENDTTAQGYTVGRPVIFNVYDSEDPTNPADHWVAMWGGGRAVGYTGDSGTAYYQSSEANLYMWNVGDDAWGTQAVGYSGAGDNVGGEFADLTANGGGENPSALAYDGDSNLEFGYISAALAVVDVNGDGDGDTLYFPVTSSYRPTDEAGLGASDAESPGSSWIYKALISASHPDDLEWCEFYDPFSGTDGTNGIGARPEVYYAATTSWRSDGSLGVYWGSGTPFDRDSSNTGYFFAMYDSDPMSCGTSAQPIPCNGNDGYYPLNSGEGLTSDPLVYAGVVYFTTYTPDTDRCEMGVGRVYGIRFDDCSPGLDTDGDGEATSADSASVETEGYVSGVTVGEQGTIYYGTATPTSDGSSAAVETITAATNPFLGTAAIAWMEIY